MIFWIILMVVIVICALFYSNIRTEVNFKRHGQDDMLIVTIVVFYGIFRFKKQVPFMDLIKGRKDVPALEVHKETLWNEKTKSQGKSIVNMNEFERMIKKYKDLYEKFKQYIVPFAKHIKPKLILNRIAWHTEIGIDDAADTAIVSGALWSTKSIVISYIYNNFNLYDVFINVTPNYSHKTFKTSIDCIFTIKLGDIISVGIKTFIAKIKDGGKNE